MKWGFWLIAIVVMTLVAALIGNAAYVRRAQARLDAALAPVHLASEPLNIAALARTPPPPEQNAALALKKISSQVEAFDTKLQAVFPPDWSDGPGVRLTDEQAAALTVLFADNAHLVDALRQAAACPDSDLPFDYAVPPEDLLERNDFTLLTDRAAVRVLAMHGTLLRHTGQWERAIENIVDMLRLAQHREREPLLINHLIAVALRGMACASVESLVVEQNVPKGIWGSLQKALVELDDSRHFARILASERAYMLDEIRYKASTKMIDLSHGWQLNQQAEVAEFFEQLIAAAHTVDPGLFHSDLSGASETSQESLASMAYAMSSHCNDLARVRTLLCMVAIVDQDDGIKTQVVFRKDQKPNEEDLTASATPIVLNNRWLDPFDGQSLRIKRTAAGWQIYSVGRNLTDDGGNGKDDAQTYVPKDMVFGPFSTQLVTP